MGGNFGEFTAIRFWQEKSFGEFVYLNRFVLDENTLVDLVWQNAVHLPNLPNFPPTKVSWYSIRENSQGVVKNHKF